MVVGFWFWNNHQITSFRYKIIRTRECNTCSLEIMPGSPWIIRISNVITCGGECLSGPSWEMILYFRLWFRKLCFIYTNIINNRIQIRVITPDYIIQIFSRIERNSTVFSFTSSTSRRGSSNMTLLSMMIFFVMIYSSLKPLHYSGYPIKIHSMLCSCKALLLSSGIRAHAVDPNTCRFDTSGLCPKYSSKGVFPFTNECGTLF